MLEKEPSDEARKSALESDYAALYAVAGLTDALAEALKGALAETQQKASKRLNELQSKRPELSAQAKAGAEDVRTFVITLPEQFKHLPDATKARIAELQKQANDLLAQATNTYADFAGRGKQAVDDVRRSSRDRSAKATKPVTPRSTEMAAASGPAAGVSSESGPVSGVSSDNGPVSGVSSDNGPVSGMSSDNGPVSGMSSESAPASGVSSDNGPASGMSSESDPASGR
ncbi:MAG: hypothetical protein K0R13_1594 [Propionibacteriaceae bacterium]|nr:hypothetical protein [Propionibacteriaceae bacterium]MDF3017011.1 hypothetical protein [Thermomicrobiales bacterium]